MRVVWTRRAENDLKEIIEYISIESIQNAESIYLKIRKAAERLEDFPQSGVLPKDETLINRGYRMLVVEKFLLFYQCEDDVIIIGIVHGAQKYAHLFN